MDAVVTIIVWLNTAANAVGAVVLAPLAALPGWLSATIVAAISGVIFLLIFKYTSNQLAIKGVKDDIKANLLALKLFKDNMRVTFSSQGRVFWGAFRLLVLGLLPMIVMVVPVLLILGQIALWYQVRPLRVGENVTVTMKLSGDADAAWPDAKLQPADAFQVAAGPARVLSKREICWKITARQNGYQHLVFEVGDQKVDKELAIGDGFMRVSMQRPKWYWFDALIHPEEAPFGQTFPVESIEIEYPRRSSWIYGSDSWVIYWFAVSMVAALSCKRLLNVNI